MMKKIIPLLFFLFLNAVGSYGQERVYFNQTDLGVTFGKVKNFDGYDTRINFAFQTFNGARIHPHHAVGISVGIDTYPTLTLMPISFGWRGILNPENRNSPYAGMDLGYGSALLEKRQLNEWSERWYEGGLMASPTIGIKRKSKKGKHAFTWSLAFRRQHAYFYEGVRAQSDAGFSNSNLRPGFNSIREESYVFNNLMAKWGLIF